MVCMYLKSTFYVFYEEHQNLTSALQTFADVFKCIRKKMVCMYLKSTFYVFYEELIKY